VSSKDQGGLGILNLDIKYCSITKMVMEILITFTYAETGDAQKWWLTFPARADGVLKTFLQLLQNKN
jgi:hypothetical protein